jgi:hypothetical protein
MCKHGVLLPEKNFVFWVALCGLSLCHETSHVTQDYRCKFSSPEISNPNPNPNFCRSHEGARTENAFVELSCKVKLHEIGAVVSTFFSLLSVRGFAWGSR